MKPLPNADRAERDQRRKRAFLPPVWPILVVVAIIIVIAVLVR